MCGGCIVDFDFAVVVALLGMNTYRMLKLFRRNANYFNNQYRKLRPDDYDDIYNAMATELIVDRQTTLTTAAEAVVSTDFYADY